MHDDDDKRHDPDYTGWMEYASDGAGAALGLLLFFALIILLALGAELP